MYDTCVIIHILPHYPIYHSSTVFFTTHHCMVYHVYHVCHLYHACIHSNLHQSIHIYPYQSISIFTTYQLPWSETGHTMLHLSVEFGHLSDDLFHLCHAISLGPKHRNRLDFKKSIGVRSDVRHVSSTYIHLLTKSNSVLFCSLVVFMSGQLRSLGSRRQP